MPYDIRDKLWQLRRLRIDASVHLASASEYFARATHGMSYRRATDTGGAGHCPLTDYALLYANERDEGREYAGRASALWAELSPIVDALPDVDARMVIGCYYNNAMTWEEVRRAVKRSEIAVQKLHREALRRMEKTNIC